MIKEYAPEPLTDFSKEENKRAFEQALELVKSQFGKEYPLIINGERIFTEKKIVSYNPSKKDEVVGVVSKATQELADRAIKEAAEVFEEWKNWAPDARARLLFKAAAIMRRRKHEMSATMVYEAGKSWVEADADTAEAIDFMEYYGRQMIRLGGSMPVTPIPGETNDNYYIPLGVGIIIPPWNFPLAILTGMTTGAVVAGNTVILKPASATPVIAAKFMEIMEEAGMPKGVINFLPGSGGEVGDFLVEHPLTRFISFTGSKEVGLRIFQKASQIAPGQKWIKRVVAEMGGKDAVLVHKDADLEAAAQAIVVSAFGYQGQKCSAGSRAIIHKDVYDVVLEKVVEKTKALKKGNPEDGSVFLGPVVDKNAFDNINRYIEIGKNEARLVLGGNSDDSVGYFIEPTIFADVDSRAVIGQEEIFGPVLSVIKAEDIDDGIRIFNDTEYGLTGSLFAKDRAIIERCRKELHCGNLYFNRKSTGAIVGAHPFGGFNMSGTDSKTGSEDYLLLFMQAKSISEVL
ncbi:L-glutamate gamma-semialdehyde dehydrogenase [Tepidibacillus fermentans]|uniref:L-glutamate gamma-semialdehyde dehydrogenase n=1 Tax=Tepidibacillus fermentans TaxID=1281767 RepID=A0A4R3KC37_9BACI|nr:L-glutamate gamma-semialdehyde dehydrogenase [Tepidibacillus fermentans]TCS80590.1 delta-1-pyrroline-5-carboxylate dehydrogenase [Tepidibacillus fermentans]